MGSSPSGSSEKADLQLTKQPAAASFRRASRRKRADDQKQAAVPRRRCRQPFAHRTLEGSAREARARRDRRAQLKEVEDREIEKIIRKQEEAGLRLATDGEFRRSWWHFDFLGMLDGVEMYDARPRHPVPRACRPRRKASASRASSDFPTTPMLDHFKFLKAHARAVPKMTIPSPGGAAFPPRAERRRHQGLCRPRRHLRRLGETYQTSDPRLLRRRLPLSAIRRYRLGLSLLAGGAARRRASAG